MSRTLSVWLLALAWVFSSQTLAVPPEVLSRAWQPPVQLMGSGDSGLAVTQLREYVALQRLVMNRTDFHQDTRRFVDGLWDSLEAFDLNRFHDLLPEEDGKGRLLRIYGQAKSSRYRLGPRPLSYETSPVVPALGDLRARVRASRIEAKAATHYLLTGDLEVGVGAISWSSVLDASEEALRLVSGDDGAFSGDVSGAAADYRGRVRAMNPDLSHSEIETLAPLWAAFPEMWHLIAGLGRIDSLFFKPVPAASYREVRASFTIDPERLERGYPTLAAHLERIDSLLEVQLDLNDRNGRLLRIRLDSQTLRAEVTMLVGDGRIIPVRHGLPVANAMPLDGNISRRFIADMDIRMNILGVIARVHGMQARIHYLPETAGARFVAAVRQTPRVTVGGRALGMVPTGLIDRFLPRRIDQLVADFLKVACEGNNGQGMSAQVALMQPDLNGPGQLSLSAAFEGLDNFLVRIGMGIVNSRIIPEPQVSEEIRQLIADAHEAFSRDLDRFERLVVEAPPVSLEDPDNVSNVSLVKIY